MDYSFASHCAVDCASLFAPPQARSGYKNKRQGSKKCVDTDLAFSELSTNSQMFFTTCVEGAGKLMKNKVLI